LANSTIAVSTPWFKYVWIVALDTFKRSNVPYHYFLNTHTVTIIYILHANNYTVLTALADGRFNVPVATQRTSKPDNNVVYLDKNSCDARMLETVTVDANCDHIIMVFALPEMFSYANE
jgi:hypothetical protein